MRYIELPASDHLGHWISGFFHWTGSPPERILPNGRIDLLFSISGDPIDPSHSRLGPQVRAALYGELRQPLTGPGSGAIDLFGVTLFPWASEIIAGVDACDLDGKIVPLDRIGLVDCKPIGRMLAACTSDIERVRRMEDLLSEVLPKAGEIEIALYRHWTDLWSRGGRQSDHQLTTDASAYPEKALERLFQRKAGMTAAQLARLARFHAFLRRVEGGEKISTLAREIGYYDQAHLTRECREFAGVPPRQLHVQLSSGSRVFRRDSWISTR